MARTPTLASPFPCRKHHNAVFLIFFTSSRLFHPPMNDCHDIRPQVPAPNFTTGWFFSCFLPFANSVPHGLPYANPEPPSSNTFGMTSFFHRYFDHGVSLASSHSLASSPFSSLAFNPFSSHYTFPCSDRFFLPCWASPRFSLCIAVNSDRYPCSVIFQSHILAGSTF